MGELGVLRFDKMSVDCELAKKYLEKQTSGSHRYGLPQDLVTDKWALDNHGNKIYYTNPKYEYKTSTLESSSKAGILVELANKIEENAELFCQLEALIRCRPKEDVRNCDIKLIVQNLLYSSTHIQNKRTYYPFFVMTDELPLAMLGFVAQLVMTGVDCIVIEASRNTFVVCHLFTELCHQVGLESVYSVFYEKTSDTHPYSLLSSQKADLTLHTGSTAVITSCSDIDSAVDALLSSTARYPWKLRRLLVQESVYDSVKNIFDWKWKLRQQENVIDHLNQSCAAVFTFQEKLFLFDYAGESGYAEDEKQVIFVEAYRTTKELLSILEQYNSTYLSLWSNDVTEANEITVNVSSNIVWLNNFGTFDGPPKASRGFFSIIEICYAPYVSQISKSNDTDKLLKLRKAWMKLDVSKRFALVEKSLKNFQKVSEPSVSKYLEDLEKCRFDFLNQVDNFVHIHDDKMCIGINNSVITCLVNNYSDDYTRAWRLLINGTAILVLNDVSTILLETFAKDGLPVVIAKEIKLDTGHVLGSFQIEFTVTKVVYQQFGTIFAN